MEKTAPAIGSFGVFIWDENRPATLWEYQGENATGEHVFSSGAVVTNDFRVLHHDPLEFWELF